MAKTRIPCKVEEARRGQPSRTVTTEENGVQMTVIGNEIPSDELLSALADLLLAIVEREEQEGGGTDLRLRETESTRCRDSRSFRWLCRINGGTFPGSS